MRLRLTASKLDLGMECLHWTAIDVPYQPSGRAAAIGTAFHQLVTDGMHTQDLSQQEADRAWELFHGWKRHGEMLLPQAGRLMHEAAYAITRDGMVRFLGTNIGRRYPRDPGLLCLTIDIEGEWIVDFKSGRKYVDAFAAWQLRAAAVATGLQRAEYHYVQPERTTVDRADFTSGELRRFKLQIVDLIGDTLAGRTAPKQGPHCDALYCPARQVCEGYAPTQVEKKETETMGKMTLGNVVTGRRETPYCLVLYGPEGIGKSTFAAGAPSPIFLGESRGTDHLEVPRFPAPESWSDVFEAIGTLKNESHDYRTFAIDTADFLEPLIWDHVCKVAKKASIEEFGYGKGYTAALDEWRRLTQWLDELIARGMNVIVLAHSHLKVIRNPLGEDYEHYELKLNTKAASLLKEWPNAVLFANYVTYAVKDENKRVRGVGDGSRRIYTEHRPAYDAKNRYGLPNEIPLSWDDFVGAAKLGEPGKVDELVDDVRSLITQLHDKEAAERATSFLEQFKTNSAKLAQLRDKLRAKIQVAA